MVTDSIRSNEPHECEGCAARIEKMAEAPARLYFAIHKGKPIRHVKIWTSLQKATEEPWREGYAHAECVSDWLALTHPERKAIVLPELPV